MTASDIAQRLEHARIEHRDLDAAIAELSERPVTDQLQMARFKKRKLYLRDHICWLENHLHPHIIA